MDLTLTQTLLQRLKETQGDTHAQAAVTAEFLLMTRPEAEREPLRAALDAATVLHWFDATLLAGVLEIQDDEAQKRYDALKTLPFTETHPAHEQQAHSIQQTTRLGWRKQLVHETPERFRALSARASACFADDATPAGRIEWIYHLLCGNPESGATELENLNRDWSSRARPEDRYALASTLQELEETHLLEGRARAWSLLTIAWARPTRGEITQLAEIAREILKLARANTDQPAEADAQCLLGDIFLTQGKLEEAQAAFAEYLAINRRLAEQNPSNADWQRELAVAHSRVGDVLQAQDKLDSALSAFTAALAISRRLLDQDPSNTVWQRDLASTHSQMGELFAALSRIEEAKEHRRRALEIRQLLASQEPDNIALQREIAIALSAFESSDDEQCDSVLRDAADSEIRSIARNLDQLRTSRGETIAVSKTAPGPAQLFICYSSEDHRSRRALESTLTILQNRGVISFWYDRKVSAGDDWNEEIQRKLDESEIVLFLISRHFLASRYINEKELPKALARHKAGKARLIPLILAACSWDKTPLYRLQTATGDRRPLRDWRDKDAAYYRIETELENVWCELRGLPRAPSHPVQ